MTNADEVNHGEIKDVEMGIEEAKHDTENKKDKLINGSVKRIIV